MSEYYAVELEERLHDMTQPYPLPWAVYKTRIAIDEWIADCQSKRIAELLLEALEQKNT